MVEHGESVGVVQADRDAAGPYMGFAFDRVKRGQCDDSGLVQAFARHRLAATPPQAGADLREALAVGEDFLNKCFSAWAAGEPSHRVRAMCDAADKFRDALALLPVSPSLGEQIAENANCSGWQPIETAPRDGGDVVLFYPLDGLSDVHPKIVLAHWHPGARWVWQHRASAGYSDCYQPTHWRPLPEPPASLHPKTPESE